MRLIVGCSTGLLVYFSFYAMRYFSIIDEPRGLLGFILIITVVTICYLMSHYLIYKIYRNNKA